MSDQPPWINPFVTVSPLHLASRPYVSESLGHTGFAPAAPSDG